MKTILVVGEGKTDIGTTGPSVLPDEAEEGVVQVLVRRVLDAPSGQLALAPRKITRLPRDRGKPKGPGLRGDARKAYDAYQLARYDYEGLIMVRDNDRDKADRASQMQAGFEAARNKPGPLIPAVCGVAIEMIETWVIAALPPEHFRAIAPGKFSEALWGDKRDPSSNHPKSVCARALASRNRKNSLASKCEVIEECDIAQLERACPRGFAPFAQALRGAFAAQSDAT